MGMNIVLVEDDHKLGEQVQNRLLREGFMVRWHRSFEAAERETLDRVGLILIDLMLPDGHGLDLVKAYRTRTQAPIVVLTALRDTAVKIRGLSLGADDYVTKPFLPEELLAHVNARLRRPDMRTSDRVDFGGFIIDFTERAVYRDEQLVALRPVELELLLLLARRPGEALSRNHLIDRAIGPDSNATERTLDVYFSRLRAALGPAGKAIETVWGIGYRLRVSR